jgi:hypothetical protein
MRTTGQISATLLALSLGACASIPLTSIPKLMSLQGEDVRISDLELAVRADEGVRVTPGSAQIMVSLTNAARGVARNETLVLQPTGAPLTPFLKQKAKRGTTIYRFRIAEADRARSDGLKQQALGLRAKPGEEKSKSQLSLGAKANLCVAAGRASPEVARMTLYLRGRPDEEFFTLVEEQRFKLDGKPMAPLKPCP